MPFPGVKGTGRASGISFEGGARRGYGHLHLIVSKASQGIFEVVIWLLRLELEEVLGGMKKWSHLNIEKGRVSTSLTMTLNIEKFQHLTTEKIMQISQRMEV